VVAILFGINISLLTFYIRKRQVASKNKKVHLTSLGGFASAVLGIGCAACGSIVLSALLSTFGAGTLIVMLPLHGLEFGLVGIILLLFSNRYLIKRIEDPLICPAY